VTIASALRMAPVASPYDSEALSLWALGLPLAEEVSYSKVRAMTRVASAENEVSLWRSRGSRRRRSSVSPL
jgi:hypothetical protein